MTERTIAAKSDLPRLLFWMLFLLVALVAVFLRTYDITLRPLHSDEGVNYHFIKSIARDGYYRYSHLNYHGPAYFYLTFLFTQSFGYGELAFRGSAILMGWALIPLLLLFLRVERRIFVLSAAMLIAFSCTQIFHSRYSIHESLFVWSGALLGFAVLLWHRTKDPRYHLLSGIGLGLLIATKETFIITLFCIFFAFIALGDLRNNTRLLWEQRSSIVKGLFLAVSICLLLFSGGLQWPGGIREMFLAVPQWIGRNESDTGHFKPFLYYTQILFDDNIFRSLDSALGTKLALRKDFYCAAAPQFALLFMLPILLYVLCKPTVKDIFAEKNANARFFAVWSFLAWLVYSCVSYKTPWLIINITLPLCLLLASLLVRFGDVFANKKTSSLAHVYFSLFLLFATTALGAYSAFVLNVKIPYGKRNPFSYVHTHQGMMELLGQIDAEVTAHGKRDVLIGTGHYWPLPYYLREHNGRTGYMKVDNPEKFEDKYDIMVVDSRTQWKHDHKKWVRRYYRLSDVQESFTYFRIER